MTTTPLVSTVRMRSLAYGNISIWETFMLTPLSSSPAPGPESSGRRISESQTANKNCIDALYLSHIYYGPF